VVEMESVEACQAARAGLSSLGTYQGRELLLWHWLPPLPALVRSEEEQPQPRCPAPATRARGTGK
jgi:hypothetical protein